MVTENTIITPCKEEMVERLARAMWKWDSGSDWDKAFAPRKNMFLALARACLSEIEAAGMVIVPREPTEEMLAAGAVAEGHGNLEAEALSLWSAMLAASPKQG
jgi:hypothetical protein